MEKMVQIFREVFTDDSIELDEESVIKELESWDSFHHINLIIALEDVFKVVLTQNEIDSMKTVGDIFELLRKKGCNI